MQLAGVRDGGPRSGTRRAACGQQEQLLGGGCASPGLDLPCCGVHPVLSLALEGHEPYGGTANTADIPPAPQTPPPARTPRRPVPSSRGCSASPFPKAGSPASSPPPAPPCSRQSLGFSSTGNEAAARPRLLGVLTWMTVFSVEVFTMVVQMMESGS